MHASSEVFSCSGGKEPKPPPLFCPKVFLPAERRSLTLQGERDDALATEIRGEEAIRRIVREEVERALQNDQGPDVTR